MHGQGKVEKKNSEEIKPGYNIIKHLQLKTLPNSSLKQLYPQEELISILFSFSNLCWNLCLQQLLVSCLPVFQIMDTSGSGKAADHRRLHVWCLFGLRS